MAAVTFIRLFCCYPLIHFSCSHPILPQVLCNTPTAADRTASTPELLPYWVSSVCPSPQHGMQVSDSSLNLAANMKRMPWVFTILMNLLLLPTRLRVVFWFYTICSESEGGRQARTNSLGTEIFKSAQRPEKCKAIKRLQHVRQKLLLKARVYMMFKTHCN